MIIGYRSGRYLITIGILLFVHGRIRQRQLMTHLTNTSKNKKTEKASSLTVPTTTTTTTTTTTMTTTACLMTTQLTGQNMRSNLIEAEDGLRRLKISLTDINHIVQGLTNSLKNGMMRDFVMPITIAHSAITTPSSRKILRPLHPE